MEQSLRVIAQENLDLEGKNLHESNVKSHKTSRNVSPTPTSAKNQTNLESTMHLSDSTDQFEEFFDIADDPLTDEEQDNQDNENKSSDASTENQSLALRSCYGSLTDIKSNELNQNVNTSPLKLSNLSLNSNDKNESKKPKEIVAKIDVDPHGWRLVILVFLCFFFFFGGRF